jgi:hypothetical protein
MKFSICDNFTDTVIELNRGDGDVDLDENNCGDSGSH